MDFSNLKIAAKICKAPVEGGNVDAVSHALEMRDNLLRASGVTRAFSVDPIEDIGHQSLGVSIADRSSSR